MATKSVVHRQFVFRATQWADSNQDRSVILPLTHSRTGQSVSNFRTLISLNQPASSSMTWSSDSFKHSPGIVVQVKPDGSPYCSTSSTGVPIEYVPFPDASSEVSANNRALIGVIKSIRTRDTSFSGPVFLAELREAVGMVRSPVKAFRDHANSLLKASRNKMSSSDTIAKTWLEWSFGAQPLMSDISSIAESALYKYNSRSANSVQRLSFTAQDKAYDSPTPNDIFIDGAVYATIRHEYFSESSVRYLCGVRRTHAFGAGAGESALNRIIGAGRFNLNEIIPTAWELIPWSFLVDYFTNVGDLLECTYNYNQDIAWAQKTIKKTRKSIIKSIAFKPLIQGYNLIAASGETATFTRVEGIRVPLSELGFPSFSFELPGFSAQYLNIAALAKTFK